MKKQLRTLVTLMIVGALSASASAATVLFEAMLSSGHVIAGGGPGSTATSTGLATFELNYDPASPSTATLTYDIQLSGADLDGAQTVDLLDDVTAVHLHDVNSCVGLGCVPGDTAGTRHVLNIYGMPRQDDINLQVMADASRLTGMWDASDANDLTPAPSFAPSDYLDELLAGELFLMLHNREFAGGAFGGYLMPVPEPASCSMLLLGGLALLGRRRR